MFEVEFVFRSARKEPYQQASSGPEDLFSAMPPLKTAGNVSEIGPVLFQRASRHFSSALHAASRERGVC